MTWLMVHQGDAPLVVTFPHTGTTIPLEIEDTLRSPWLALKDTDWWVDALYAFARDLGATTIRTGMSRTVIDVNRDPSGVSLYPGQITTGLCPTETFDGEPFYRPGEEPDEAEIARRRAAWFDPYHRVLSEELARLRRRHAHVVLYDAHSIRGHVPRLFPGDLPDLNVGTNGGTTCAPALADAVMAACTRSPYTHILDGRFKGGWTTRHYGNPSAGIHAVQMELAMRTYLAEPPVTAWGNWPADYDPDRAAPLQSTLREVLEAAIAFAKGHA
jgi:N-formylglutamate deformylase